MKFGVQHGVGDSRWTPAILRPEEVRRFVSTAERCGYGAVAFTDHPAPSGRWVDSGGEGVADLFTSLAFCAAASSTIRLLSWVLVPPYRNPFVTAHQIATLDHLSAGRVTLGLGTGYLKSEFYALGTDPANRRTVFEENVEVMKLVWEGHDVHREGIGFSANGVRSVPAALQQPHPPLWVHGNTQWGMDYAVAHAEGWIGMIVSEQQVRTIRTRAIVDLAAFARRVEDLAVACDRAGRQLSDIEIVNTGIWPMLDVRDGLDATKMRAQVAELESLGVSWIVFNVCGDDPDISIDSVEWVAANVIGR
jgi:probable F420-dependent oxidoreductase